MLPALGAYVGGDIVAGMLASGMDRDTRVRLFIDVGTNCEIVLSDGHRIVSTAAPAGPAFEGGAIRCGMRAADGAIEVITLDPEAGSDQPVTLGVIGDVEPRGRIWILPATDGASVGLKLPGHRRYDDAVAQFADVDAARAAVAAIDELLGVGPRG